MLSLQQYMHTIYGSVKYRWEMTIGFEAMSGGRGGLRKPSDQNDNF